MVHGGVYRHAPLHVDPMHPAAAPLSWPTGAILFIAEGNRTTIDGEQPTTLPALSLQHAALPGAALPGSAPYVRGSSLTARSKLQALLWCCNGR